MGLKLNDYLTNLTTNKSVLKPAVVVKWSCQINAPSERTKVFIWSSSTITVTKHQWIFIMIPLFYYIAWLRFHHFIWSFQVYTVKIKKRPTILWCLIQRGLLPCSQNFVNLWFHLLIIYILRLLYELLAQFASSLTMVVTQTGINGPHATLLAILTYTNVMLSP